MPLFRLFSGRSSKQSKGAGSGCTSTIHDPAFAVSATVGHVSLSPEAYRKKRLDPFNYRYESGPQGEEVYMEFPLAKSAPTRIQSMSNDDLSGQPTRHASAATSASASCTSSRQASTHPSPRAAQHQPCARTDELHISLPKTPKAPRPPLAPPQLVMEYTTPRFSRHIMM
eukprot:GHVU01063722.1.p1 GENE.GHVU01063722.1~~GHVU01063722.1.p1  ORF type:complete len:170 (-),score=11.03 GHVU01063722.1:85-594(-)